jgi:DNA (cytosine-5)-methyltransferase 1
VKTFASICTGGGLADIGFQSAGLNPIWGIEIEPSIAEVASANLKHKVYVDSAIGFNWHNAERPDHLHISPPCQNASIANSKGGEGELDKAISLSCCEAIECFKPKSFTLENVAGYRVFWSFRKIVDTLWGLGYWCNVDILDAADYGVPQNRKRLILRAVLGGFPAPLSESTKWQGWYESIEDLIPLLPESSFAQWQLDLMPEVYSSILVDGQNARSLEKGGLNYRVGGSPSFTVSTSIAPRRAFLVDGTANDRGSSVTIRDRQEPCFTLKASQNKKPVRAWDEGRIVALNARCLARLQTLPDWYELPNNSKLASKIIGNGVPCNLAKAIAGVAS